MLRGLAITCGSRVVTGPTHYSAAPRCSAPQGGFLDSLQRALALHPFLLALQAHFPNARVMAIHDDIKIIGSNLSVLNVFSWAEAYPPAIGGRLEVTKSEVFGVDTLP